MNHLIKKCSMYIGTSLLLLFFLMFSALASAGDAVLSWDPNDWNVDPDLAGYKVYYGTTSGNYTDMIDIGLINPNGAPTYTVNNLADGKTYYFAVTAYDTSGNESGFSNEASKTIATTDTIPPVISAIGTSNITSSSANIIWTTDEPATSQIEYGTSTTYGSASTLDSTMAASHSRTLSGLTPSTTYHFRVKSTDASGNTATSGDNTFTTSAGTDTTSPAISGITTTNITTSGATITWTTNESSSSQVEYGTTTAYGSASVLDLALVASHSQTLNGLQASTTYHFRVKSTDASGNTATSGDNTFTTSATADTIAPAISSISSNSITSDSASIIWITDEASTSQVEYGTTTTYGSSTTLSSTLITGHSLTLSGLQASTTYHYRVKSADTAGNSAISGDNTFTTSGTTPPNSNTCNTSTNTWQNTSLVTQTNVVIAEFDSIPNNNLMDGITGLSLGSATGYANLATIARFNSNGNIDARNGGVYTANTVIPYTAGNSYHFRLVINIPNHAYNIYVTPPNSSEITLGLDYAFRTEQNTVSSLDNWTIYSALGTHQVCNFTISTQSSDMTAPTITSISASSITSTSASISWTTNEASSSQVEYGTTTAYGSLSSLNSALNTSHSRNLAGLQASATYHYRVKSTDTAGNQAVSGDNIFTTSAAPDTTAPTISGITASNITMNSASITWGTDEPATDEVEYGLTTSYGISTTRNSSMLNSHTQTLTGLISNTTYHYRAKSADAAGNQGVTGDNIFITGSAIDTEPPADVKDFSAAGSDKKITLSWTNPPDSDFVGVRIVFRTDRFPDNINDGELLGDFTGQSNAKVSTTHSGLQNGITYYYIASTYDNYGNFQSTASASGTPSEEVSNNIEPPHSNSGGGCGMIIPKDGKPPGPGQMTDMLAIVGVIFVLLIRKTLQAGKPSRLEVRNYV